MPLITAGVFLYRDSEFPLRHVMFAQLAEQDNSRVWREAFLFNVRFMRHQIFYDIWYIFGKDNNNNRKTATKNMLSCKHCRLFSKQFLKKS